MPNWNADSLMELARAYQLPCVLAAAARLDLFSAIGIHRTSAQRVADRLKLDPRALTMLLDALVSADLMDKQGDEYCVPQAAYDLLASGGRTSVLPYVRHLANILPQWADLTETIRTGIPATVRGSYPRPPTATEDFIGAMDVLAASTAPEMARDIDLTECRTLLDVGGGPATYTIAFLKANPGLSVVLFDRPEVIPLARHNLERAGLIGRVRLVGGDFMSDELPRGCDTAWVSAIIHQNSRPQNRELFARIHRALEPGGELIIRDHVMDESHTAPPSGAMFAINMLASTQGGGTYSFNEIRQDLQQTGWINVEFLIDRAGMNCLLAARKKA